MEYNDKDILFASLVGSNVNLSRFAAVQNELAKHVLPPIPFLPFKNETKVNEVSGDLSNDLWKSDIPLSKENQFFPFSFEGDDGKKFLLPYEPLISITGKNTIIRRNVAKSNGLTGSVKERWNQADYEISITGVLIGSILTGSVQECYPIDDFQKLKGFMTKSKSLKVFSEPLGLLGIFNIVIEDFSFPFTKGENVQAYEIKAFSDSSFKLLLDVKD